MTNLLQSIQNIKQYLSINVNMNMDTLNPYIDNALMESIEPWLGAEIIEDFETNINENTGVYPIALPHLQRSLVYFSILKALPFLEVNIGDEGITRTETEHVKTAYRGQVSRIERQLLTDAFNSLERLCLVFDAENYDKWENAPAYVYFQNFIFKSSQDFSRHYPLVHGRLTYSKLINSINYITEFNVKSKVGVNQYNDFLAHRNDLSKPAIYQKAVNYLKSATAFLSVAQALVDDWIEFSGTGVVFKQQVEDTEQHNPATAEQLNAKITSLQQRGETYLAKLKELLNNNESDFPIYEADNSVRKRKSDNFRGVGRFKGGFGV